MSANKCNIDKSKAGTYFKTIIHSVRNMRFLFKITMYILMPVVVFTIFFSYLSYTYQNQYTELVKQNYLTKLESVCNNIENTISLTSNIINNSTYEYTTGEIPANKYASASNILLSQLRKTDNSLLNSIFVFDRTHSCVYDEKGTHNAVAYFTDTQEYSSYPMSYWDNYPYANEPTRSLRPSLSFQNNTSSLLIPIVFSDTGLFKGTDCLVVVNVDISKIIEYENKSKLSKNTEFLIVNNTTGSIFNKNMNFTKKPDNKFRENVISFENNIFDTLFDDERYLTISYRPSHTPNLPYTYVAAMPYDDVRENTNRFTTEMLVLFILTMIVIFFVVRFSATRIFKPIEDLSNLFSERKSDKSKDPINSIKEAFFTLSDQNTSLSTQISSLLPLATERKLIEALNGIDVTLDSESFKYKYFCSVIIGLIPTKKLFKTYTSEEYKSIKQELSNVIIAPFPDSFDIYSIPANPDTIYILVNSNNSDCSGQIMDILKEFKDVLKHDDEYISVEYAIGGVYQGIDGIKTSHNEATAAFSTLSSTTASQINLNSRNKSDSNVPLSIKTENTIYNMLILGKTDEAKDIIRDIIDQKVKYSANDSMTNLYIQILNLIFKVMRAKKINFDHYDVGELNLISSIIDNPKSKIHNTIMDYIDILDASTGPKKKNAKIDVDDFAKYLDAHYTQDLSLSKVAENLGTTPKYLSKLIKTKYNITFTEYLATLRVNAAKELLVNSKLNIAEIYPLAGFNSKNTFLRVFKTYTGVNPSDFRKTKKQTLL